MLEALKWLGYIVAAIAVLSVVIGIGTLLTIGAAVFCLVIAVVLIAALIRSLVSSR